MNFFCTPIFLVVAFEEVSAIPIPESQAIAFFFKMKSVLFQSKYSDNLQNIILFRVT